MIKYLRMENSTIVAQATANGKSGINIIRLSGKDSLKIAKQIFCCKNFLNNVEPNFMYFGKVNLGEVLDKGYCVYFKSPKSFTGEDIVEFHCHGGRIVAQKVVEQCLSFGARLAEAGEFSKRAFLNGKMSLDEAEGVVETINAETENQLKAASDLTSGNLYLVVKDCQKYLVDILSEIEVNLDYPEHDIEYQTKEKIKLNLDEIKNKIKELLSTEQKGKLIKDGVNIAIVGKTNVGKSSLLNALINYDQAIVTDIEGTTRDVVSASIEYNGLKLNFYDTAGIRKTNDEIENIGIEKSKKTLENSDIALYVFDCSRALDEQDQKSLNEAQKRKAIIVFNKCDLQCNIKCDAPHIKVSAKQKLNVEELKKQIYELATNDCKVSSQIVLTNLRHITILKEAKALTNNALENIQAVPLDCVALDVRSIWEKLGEITGESASEEIIDKIFSKFCLGK